jgi:fructoselysine-6-P-deglycase FrlB-like protein
MECQLIAITKERDSLMCTNEKLCSKINEVEILRKNSVHTVSLHSFPVFVAAHLTAIKNYTQFNYII